MQPFLPRPYYRFHTYPCTPKREIALSVFDRYISVIEKPKVYFDKVIDFDLWIKSLTVSLDVGATRS